MSTSGSLPPPAKAGIDFESLPWNLNCPEEHSYIHLTTTGEWNDTQCDAVTAIKAYAQTPLPLWPSTTSLNYGTTIWEGLKCFRMESGKAAVFRPDMNWKRFVNGAHEMCLPAPSRELFMRCVQTACQTNAHLIPPCGDGVKLYVRPMLLGSGQQLGLYPSPQFSLLFFVSPTGNYFKGKAVGGLKLHLETKRSRAARGGLGSVKCSGNYAVTLKPLMDAKKEGFDDNLYMELDTYVEGKIEEAVIQELSAANIFLVLKSGEIVTPSLDRKTILPGVTRDSILVLARQYAIELQDAMKESTGDETVQVSVSERDVKVGDLNDAVEVFITGTAAEVVPVASLATGSKDSARDIFSVTFKHGKTLPGGPVTAKLLSILREVMLGKRTCDATKGWLRDPFASAEEFCADM